METMKTHLLMLVFAVHSLAICQSVVYPLQVGTRWRFQGLPMAYSTPSAPREVIKDTMMANGKRYAAILYEGGSGIEYQRTQNDSVFIYNIYSRSESLLYRFNLNEKDTVVTITDRYPATDIILVDTTIVHIFGTSRRVFKFLIDTRLMVDEEKTIWIADGIGVIRIVPSFGEYTAVQGAIIDGITLGSIHTFARSYYPLSVGNRWSNTDGTTVKVVDDSLFENGYRYSVLSNRDFAGGKYVRTDSQHVYYYDTYRKKDVPFFKLNGRSGDVTTFEQPSLGYSRSTIGSIDTVIMFGEQTRVIQYKLDALSLREVSLSDKFGPVAIALYADPPPPWPDIVHTATGCIIDGWTYGVVTSVHAPEPAPAGYSLSQNFPNPFNPSTLISFSLPSRTHVSLKIFDIMGRQIATLSEEELPPGPHSRLWNAGNASSGVYVYRLRAGTFTDSRCMMFIK